MDKIDANFRVKREGLDQWVPQYSLVADEILWWNDFYGNDNERMIMPTRDEALSFIERNKGKARGNNETI